MANIWMIISLHDNDFWLDLTFLGELITRVMEYFDAKKLPDYLLNSPDYREYLKSYLFDAFVSVYKLRHILDANNYFPNSLEDNVNTKAWLETDHDALVKLSAYFKDHFKLYFSSEEFDHAMSLISSDSLSKHWSEVKHIDEFKLCNGNYEYLIIHCCNWECKSLVI